ncbi:MAG: hypothetical protein CMJ89_09105 [Planctomycetes bacterium]|nr:hypothetical protein [Planctomycetota bacterium]
MASRPSRTILLRALTATIGLCLVWPGPAHVLDHEHATGKSCVACDLVGPEPPVDVRFEGPVFGASALVVVRPQAAPVQRTRLVDAPRGPPGVV